EADDRIMVKAADGETGGYLYFAEGTDNDKDGAFNEDGAGGINFNSSLTWDFPYFQPGAGDFPVADKENRALLDFLFERWNVFALVTFGSSDNLNAPIKYNAGEASKRVLKGMLKTDADANALVSKSYADIVGKKEGAQSVVQGGGFTEWGYFHYARYSFGTPAWSWPEFKMPEDSTAKAKYTPNKDKNKEVDYLRWAEANNHDLFVQWKAVNHPDFPGKKVEVGSWKPFAPYNPPFSLVADISAKQNKFIAKLATMKPQVKIENLTTEAVGKGMTRITADIFNAGTLATMTELAQKTRWVRMTKVEMVLSGSQQIISGDKVKLISSIEGGDKVTMSWLVKGSGSVTLSAGSAQTGIDTKTITLK
ncbi:MAG: peptidase, partial [Imperialibacter sp.]